MRRALAFRHVAFEDLGSMRTVLEQRGWRIEYLEAGDGDFSAIDPLEADLLVALGGPLGVYQAEDYPCIGVEIELLRRRINADLPTLGICFGSQLMAAACGSRVYPSGIKEIGWAPLELSAEGARGPLRHLAGGVTPVMHWHGDTFDLPPGATRLASTPQIQNQAFAVGRSLALQFHPEVERRGLEHWFIGHAGEIDATPGVSVAQLRADTARHAERLRAQCGLFFSEWLDAVIPA